MTYWTVVADETERSSKKCKVFKQLNKPGPKTQRLQGYSFVHGHRSKKDAIDHLNKLGVANNLRPQGYKTYDA